MQMQMAISWCILTCLGFWSRHAGLLRCGKSCRLRWTNYLRPDLKRGLLSSEEEALVIDLHAVELRTHQVLGGDLLTPREALARLAELT